ncbi:MAG TPA: twin-arginine translocase TatA/TatE family subunit [Thermoanaerobaculia bacterium]|nr:twin-arginine translocase TatA/TatE family subunit [Thermoanaerobaculia bacterium]
MGPIGLPEMLLIAALALLLFGPRRLPEIGRSIGKAFGEFKRASDDLKRTFNAEIALEESQERARQRMAAAALPAPAGVEARAPRSTRLEVAPPPSHSPEHAELDEASAQSPPETASAASEGGVSATSAAPEATGPGKAARRPRAPRTRKATSKAESPS